MNKIKILVKEVGKPAEVRLSEHDNKTLRDITGGSFSGYCAYSFAALPSLRNVYLLCNDTGKLDGLPFNCFIGLEDLVGNVIFMGSDYQGNSISLTDRQIADLQKSIFEFVPREVIYD